VAIERVNSRLRHWFARFRRRTCVVSKALEMVDATSLPPTTSIEQRQNSPCHCLLNTLKHSASPSSRSPAAVMESSSQSGFAGWWTSFSAGTAESLSLLIPYPRAGHAALLNVVHWLERRRDREPLAGPNDVVATAGLAAAQGDDPPRPADPTLSCRPPTDRIEGGCP